MSPRCPLLSDIWENISEDKKQSIKQILDKVRREAMSAPRNSGEGD